MAKQISSPKFSITKEDFKSIARGALIAGGGAIAIYLLEMVPKLNLGDYTPIAVALASVLLNALRKYLSVNKY